MYVCWKFVGCVNFVFKSEEDWCYYVIVFYYGKMLVRNSFYW